MAAKQKPSKEPKARLHRTTPKKLAALIGENTEIGVWKPHLREILRKKADTDLEKL